MSDITPERIAEHLHGSEVFENRALAGFVDVACEGAVLRIGFTPKGKPSQIEHFRAVVVPGEGPVVVASQEFLAAARALYRAHVIGAALPDEEYARAIYDRQEALNALTPEQLAVLAGDDENGGDDDV